MFFGSGAPLHRHIEARRNLAVPNDRPVLLAASGKGMDYGEIARLDRRQVDARHALRGNWQRGKKRERQVADRMAELRAIGPVPGINGIEGFEVGHAGLVEHADQVQAGIGDGAGAVGKAEQRQHTARRPNLGVIGASGFEGGERKDAVANCARTNQQSALALPSHITHSGMTLSGTTSRLPLGAKPRRSWGRGTCGHYTPGSAIFQRARAVPARPSREP